MTDSLSPIGVLRLLVQENVATAKPVLYQTLAALPKQPAYQSQIRWGADVGGSSSTGRATSADAGTNNQDNVVPANLAIGQACFSHVFSVLKTDVVQARNTAPAALRNLFEAHVQRGINRILRDTNAALFNGDGTNAKAGVIGLETVADNTASYAGISPTTYSRWAVTLDGNAGTARNVTKSLLFKIERMLEEAEGQYTHVIMPPAIKEAYINLFDTSRVISPAQGGGVGDVGVSGIQYNGRPVIADPACTAGTIFLIDATDVSVHTHVVDGAVDFGGLYINVGSLPSQNSLAEKYELTIMPALQVFNRKSVAVLEDLK